MPNCPGHRPSLYGVGLDQNLLSPDRLDKSPCLGQRIHPNLQLRALFKHHLPCFIQTPKPETGKESPQKTVENLERELQRLKARRIDTGNPGADADPAQRENNRKNGWNYVSSYLQNRF